MKAVLVLPVLLLLAAHPVPPRELRGRAGADCRDQEAGPAARLLVERLKDRQGRLVLELYPATDQDFLAADKVLIAEGKVFRRVRVPAPAAGKAELCIRVPGPGRYALSVLHDRDGDGRFNWLRDGVGFPGNPRLGASKPRAAAVAVAIGPGVETRRVTLQYRRGLGFAPIAGGTRP
jgi:uncharacterized protein (DUF2141 family)